ncbi:MAG: hypothetical protein ACLQDF_14175 [Desulfomonilia bacterium]
MFRKELPRIYELRDLITVPSQDALFQENFDSSLRDSPDKKSAYKDWEEDLQGLDSAAWDYYKTRSKSLLTKKHPKRDWQELFDARNEVKGYNYLRRIRCKDVSFISPFSRKQQKKTPDLRGSRQGQDILCEVKTINISEAEIDAQIESRKKPTVRKVTTQQLKEGFLGKLVCTLVNAHGQLKTHDPNHQARWLIYMLINFDDSLAPYFKDQLDDYFQQIYDACNYHLPRFASGLNQVVFQPLSRAGIAAPPPRIWPL